MCPKLTATVKFQKSCFDSGVWTSSRPPSRSPHGGSTEIPGAATTTKLRIDPGLFA